MRNLPPAMSFTRLTNSIANSLKMSVALQAPCILITIGDCATEIIGKPAIAAPVVAMAAPVKGRLVWREAGGARILDDTYNANPVSVRAALDALREAPGGGRRWVILGDMLELGPLTESAHREVGALVAALPVAGLATVGAATRVTADVARAGGCPEVATFATPEGAAAHMIARVARGDRVLVKGSRGMRMERAVDALMTGLALTREAPRC